MTHDELIHQAISWLTNRKRCSVVASELATGSGETPDVIGWSGWCSTLIEAKISMNDFRADQRKFYRRYEANGMGVYRYYIVPFELKEKVLSGLPEGWGLLLCKQIDEWNPNSLRLKVEKGSKIFENDKNREVLFLSSVIRRISGSRKPLKGIAVNCYTIDTPNPRAKLFIKDHEQGSESASSTPAIFADAP